MKIRNIEIFSPDVEKALNIYYTCLVQSRKKEYKESISDLKFVRYLITKYENRIYNAEKIIDFIEKHRDNKILMFILRCPDKAIEIMEKYMDKNICEIMELEEDEMEYRTFVDSYGNLVENGLLITKSGENSYNVEPYKGGIYVDLTEVDEVDKGIIKIRNE